MTDEEQAFQRTDDGDLKAPTLIATDYLEIAVLAVVLCIGVPLNAVVLRKLLRQYSAGKALSRTKQDETRIGFLMLKIHLTIVDLIFIMLYCPGKLIWLICYVWPFGVFLCKATQYLWMFAHHSMSFAIVSIAIDRVKTVYDLMAMREHGRIAPPKSKINCIKLACPGEAQIIGRITNFILKHRRPFLLANGFSTTLNVLIMKMSTIRSSANEKIVISTEALKYF
ncbi:unnamed protein product [Toxocara canis]|uniref:G_PROTEIN_RECEP_F1_2 domain-containing protein n=1 Tax=Toxocara canis TaxID=6265 RepID=A0A183TZI8_TOXCA|nr:unnamed protein product [Toxocara canis]